MNQEKCLIFLRLFGIRSNLKNYDLGRVNRIQRKEATNKEKPQRHLQEDLKKYPAAPRTLSMPSVRLEEKGSSPNSAHSMDVI